MKEFSQELFAKKIRFLRKNQHITQEEFSEILGIKINTYARYETDTLPPISTLYKMSQALGVSVDFLLSPVDFMDYY